MDERNTQDLRGTDEWQELQNWQEIDVDAKVPMIKRIRLPLVALGLDLMPFLIYYVLRFNMAVTSFFLLSAVMFPIFGAVTAIAAIREGKKEIGVLGMVIAILAFALPLVFVGAVLIFVIGAMTGMIALM